MKFIITIIKKLTTKNTVPPLGRWNINYCNNIINKKIDLSNTDHCGPCGEHTNNESNNNIKDLTIVKPKFIMKIKNN